MIGRFKSNMKRLIFSDDNFTLKYFVLCHLCSLHSLDKTENYAGKTTRHKKTGRKIKDEKVTYTLHKPVRKSFPRRRVLVHGIDIQWKIDLVDLSSPSRVNDDYKLLLTCIDVLTEYASVMECTSFPRKMTTYKPASWNVSREHSKKKCLDTLLIPEIDHTWTLWMISFCRTTTVHTEQYNVTVRRDELYHMRGMHMV